MNNEHLESYLQVLEEMKKNSRDEEERNLQETAEVRAKLDPMIKKAIHAYMEYSEQMKQLKKNNDVEDFLREEYKHITFTNEEILEALEQLSITLKGE